MPIKKPSSCELLFACPMLGCDSKSRAVAKKESWLEYTDCYHID